MARSQCLDSPWRPSDGAADGFHLCNQPRRMHASAPAGSPLSGPVHLVVVGNSSQRATKALAKAALRARPPGWVVQILDPAKQADMVGKLGFPADGVPAAYLCVGKQCLAPIHSRGEVWKWTRPGALAPLVA